MCYYWNLIYHAKSSGSSETSNASPYYYNSICKITIILCVRTCMPSQATCQSLPTQVAYSLLLKL